ncbi:TPA: ABC transporter ATP-binding protein [Candidatus Poribacteria bacterium]|nr:ABC transporter ATP-binding protein [Candidatus Poribacteria bacterium]HIA70956.1 ABC transporter ATP-binding protein [Candidatus Poribacteria bacterium]HIB87806.1 ABC transporter ATP-binding protein [Candidatus Poribacteria bacterium]HIC00080.1 ABC transporter ATP-binding protein [Candidatus Poribacteria bacterium]HIC20155.1 ABC transporter ATP-binding protein [Candidatus Poribacteria bacterium]
MDNSVLIDVRHLVKTFPMEKHNFTALNKINLKFKTGEFTGLVGPSGSGKTTLLNVIGSLDAPTEGEVRVLGQSLDDLNPKKAANFRNRYLGFIFQTYNLLPVYNVYENVEYPLLLLKMPAAERKKTVLQSLEWVDLTDKIKSRPSQLSGGECQRVSIARAMVKTPKIVLADEPTANLDAENSHHILQTMLKLNQNLKTTFIFATHDDKVIQYLRRKIRLDDGQVVGDETITNH